MKINIQNIINLYFKMFNLTLSRDQDKTENQALSPYSFLQVLGLLANGTDDETSNKFIGKLGFEPNINDFNINSNKINEILTKKRNRDDLFVTCDYIVTNYLFHSDKFIINEDFKTLISNFYNIKISSYNPKKVIDDYKNFYHYITNGTNIIFQHFITSFGPDMCLLKENNFYLKQEWSTNFDFFRVEDFTTYAGKVKQDMMYNYIAKKYNFYEDEKIIAVKMLYKNSDSFFLAVMPKKIEDWDEVTKKICSENELNCLISRMEYGNVNLTFPKFRFEYEVDFITYSKDLGIDSMLNSLKLDKLKTDFKYENLEIKQNVLIDVYEFGFVTHLVSNKSVKEKTEANNFRVLEFNKPFLWFVIRQDDNFTCSLPIFMGKFIGPKK
ncbi:serpin-type proteinase inhibitor 3 [Vairimorpha necatrix]|uniref:Serpin-type proteinase inhibitor 3 n=1 Tax=Vairimorpha necatrix TaxID=6039 RepID=A0AAX4JGQ2_9MICR